jgi:hypothetical protein
MRIANIRPAWSVVIFITLAAADYGGGTHSGGVVSVAAASPTITEGTGAVVDAVDVQIEGRVDAILALYPFGESRFVVRGQTVVVRPEETLISEGGRRRAVTDLVLGRRLLVRGESLPGEPGGQPALAREISLQAD